MTELEQAEMVLARFKESMEEGHPWVPGVAFVNNPGLDRHVLMALEDFARHHRALEQSKPAKRVSLSDNPNWRPSSVAPVLPGSKDWVEPDDEAGA